MRGKVYWRKRGGEYIGEGKGEYTGEGKGESILEKVKWRVYCRR